MIPEAARIWVELRVADEVARRGGPVQARGWADEAWFEGVRKDAGGGFLTVAHPALLRAIECKVNEVCA